MIEMTPDEPPEGSWRTKFQLGRVLPEGIDSCPMVKDKHLAVAVWRQAVTVMKT